VATTIEEIAGGSLCVSVIGLIWAIILHARNDAATARRVRKLEKRFARHEYRHDSRDRDRERR
jgi:hypothetical protein